MTTAKKTFIRSNTKKQEEPYDPYALLKVPNRPGVIYVRQSTTKQREQHPFSFEVQTDQFLEFFRERMGVTAHIETITSDIGISGTLDSRKRLGLARVERLINGEELLKGERIAWIAAVGVDRITRDEYMIVPGTLVKYCTENDVIIVTVDHNRYPVVYNFKDKRSVRDFMDEAERAAAELDRMRKRLGIPLQLASDKGMYDGRSVVPGYIVDRRKRLDNGDLNPTYKRFIEYEPHAKIVKALFKRFMELGGNMHRLFEEISAKPYVFPAFEPWTDDETRSKFSFWKMEITDGPYKGAYRVTENGLWNLLQNPVYTGDWYPRNNGIVENNHARLIDDTLFNFAHKRLSKYNLQGVRVKPDRVTRNGKGKGLLVKVMRGSHPRSVVYVNPTERKGDLYDVNYYEGGRIRFDFSVGVNRIDTPFVAKFLDRLSAWEQSGKLADWKEQLDASVASAEKGIKRVNDDIRAARERIENIDNQLETSAKTMSKERKNRLNERSAELEARIDELEQEKLALKRSKGSEEATVLHDIWSIIPKIREMWKDFTFETRVTLVSAFVRNAVISLPCAGWLMMEIEWKLGQRDVMYLPANSNGVEWTPEDENTIRELYPSASMDIILERLPGRSWNAICAHGRAMKVRRTVKHLIPDHMEVYLYHSLKQVCYAEENGLCLSGKNAQWPSLV